jgi:hypothetical protein
MITTFFDMIRFLFFPPGLSTLYKIGSEYDYFRFWGLINEMGYRRYFKIIRPLWHFLPRFIVYRLFIIPYFLFYMIIKSIVASKSLNEKDIGNSTISQFFSILDSVLKNPGLFPDDFLTFNLHLPQNDVYAKGSVHNFHIRFLIDLLSFAQGSKTSPRFSVLANNKLKFHDFLYKNRFPVAEIIAHFSEGKIDHVEHSVRLPKQDLFLKPVASTLSIGASVVIFDQESDKYQIQKPFKPFPARLSFDGYPQMPLTDEQLVKELTRLGKALPLLLQPKLNSHPSLVELCGEDESLVTARIITSKEVSGSSNLLMAFLRLSSKPGGAALPVSGGIAARIDPVSCQISRATTKYGGKIKVHPFTHLKFKGFIVPFAKEAIRDCLEIHDALAEEEKYFVPIVGFDIALSDRGYFFMEANSPCDLYFQKMELPLLFNKHFNKCLHSHIKLIQNSSMIHPDPILRKKTILLRRRLNLF